MFVLVEDEGWSKAFKTRLQGQSKISRCCRWCLDLSWRQTVTCHFELLSAERERNVTKCKDWMCKSYKLNAPIDQEGSPNLIWHSLCWSWASSVCKAGRSSSESSVVEVILSKLSSGKLLSSKRLFSKLLSSKLLSSKLLFSKLLSSKLLSSKLLSSKLLSSKLLL